MSFRCDLKMFVRHVLLRSIIFFDRSLRRTNNTLFIYRSCCMWRSSNLSISFYRNEKIVLAGTCVILKKKKKEEKKKKYIETFSISCSTRGKFIYMPGTSLNGIRVQENYRQSPFKKEDRKHILLEKNLQTVLL